MNISELQKLIMAQAKEKRWGTVPEDVSVLEKLALVHSEVSEALQAYRHNNIDGKDGFYEELGDIIMRVLHLAGIYGVDIEKKIVKKIEINKGREWK